MRPLRIGRACAVARAVGPARQHVLATSSAVETSAAAAIVVRLDALVAGSDDGGHGGLSLLAAGGAVHLRAMDGDGSGGAIDGDELAGVELVGGGGGGDDGRDAVFAGDERGVGGEGSSVGDDGGGVCEQGCPGGCGGLGDEDVAVGEGG